MSSLIRSQAFRTVSTWHKPDEINMLVRHVSASPCYPGFDGIPSGTRVGIQKSQPFTDAGKVMLWSLLDFAYGASVGAFFL